MDSKSPIVILGVDPGLASTGIGVIVQRGQREWGLLHHAVVTSNERQPMPERLDKIHRLVHDAVVEYKPHHLSIESIFFARNVRSAVLMAHGRGVAIHAAASPGIELHEYSPLEIKQSVVGSGKAGKEQVRQMVAVLLGMAKPPKTDHEADALAAALCHAFRGVSSLATQVRAAAGGAADPAGSERYDERKALLAMMLRGPRKRKR